jgi:hypothetical protein
MVLQPNIADGEPIPVFPRRRETGPPHKIFMGEIVPPMLCVKLRRIGRVGSDLHGCFPSSGTLLASKNTKQIWIGAAYKPPQLVDKAPHFLKALFNRSNSPQKIRQNDLRAE